MGRCLRSNVFVWVLVCLWMVGCGRDDEDPSQSPTSLITPTPAVTPETGIPALIVSALELDFGTVEVEDEAFATLTVTNGGTGTLDISAATISPPDHFYLTPGTFPVSLKAGESDTWKVYFAPKDDGKLTATLVIYSDDTSRPEVNVNLKGKGYAPDTSDPDDDGDGYPASNDCDDNNEDVNPGQSDDNCDGEDNNCDGATDEAADDNDDDGLNNCEDPCPDDLNNDEDADGLCGGEDLCPTVADDGTDSDDDGVGDTCDLCPDSATDDSDGDTLCDDLDPCPDNPEGNTDSDEDGQVDCVDQCPLDAQNDADEDGVCANEDPCPLLAGGNQDTDRDGLPDCADTCPQDPQNDQDGDNVCGDVDLCPTIADDQTDSDGDGIGDACAFCSLGNGLDPDHDTLCGVADLCPDVADDGADGDEDGLGDACELCPGDPGNDPDKDGVCAAVDVCPLVSDDQTDTDLDGKGDSCDLCPLDKANDFDGDGVCGNVDVCPTIADDQTDTDGDGTGDACSGCTAGAGADPDRDTLCGAADSCPEVADTGIDTDGDQVGDACDPCPADSPDDTDGDGTCDSQDPCPAVTGDFADSDADGTCDGQDLCPQNPGVNTDDDQDGLGDLCDICPTDPKNDEDGDHLCAEDDPCPTSADNTTDKDRDGVIDGCDSCPKDYSNDFDGDGECDQVPPPAKDLANRLDLTVGTTVDLDSDFVWQGDDAIQTGVDTEQVDRERLSVLKGSVTVDDDPMPGVTVTIRDHSEYGHTVTQTDGSWDMVVNGGEVLTVDFDRKGFLPIHRDVKVPWQRFVQVGNVSLTRPDSASTTVDTSGESTEVQVHQGSVVTDEDGPRRVTVLIPPGTSATVVVDGQETPADSLNIRTTEYTVGDRGPDAMPATLPHTSAYTFAVELGADEVTVQSGGQIHFNQPLPVYVENFLNFPPGTSVPAGYYDRIGCGWVASEDGRVITLVDVADGIASVDTDGDGIGDDGETLAFLGINPDELTTLATLYSIGQSLWRVPVTHFTPWDFNWPFSLPPDAFPPNNPPPVVERPVDNFCQGEGPIQSLEDRSPGIDIPLPGTPTSLHHRGDRMPGRTSCRALDIQLTDYNLPQSVTRIDLKVDIAGQLITRTFSPQADLHHHMVWDGLDSYGRVVQGQQIATVSIDWVFAAAQYQNPTDFTRSFGLASGVPLETNRTRREISLRQTFEETLGCWDTLPQGIGGFDLAVHHVYDVQSKRLLRGDGHNVTGRVFGNRVSTVAGDGSYGVGSDGQLATNTSVAGADDLTVDGRGNTYILQRDLGCVRKVDRKGILSTVAGVCSASYGYGGYGGYGRASNEGAATATYLYYPSGLTVDCQDNLYISDTYAARVVKVDRDGNLTTFAGNGSYGFSGDGGLAVNAQIADPGGMAVDTDCNVYFADQANHRIRRVDAMGVITTVAGDGGYGYYGDGGPATQAGLAYPMDLEILPDGSLVVADTYNSAIRQISPDGIIFTLVGGYYPEYIAPFGGESSYYPLYYPNHLASDRQGNIFVANNTSVIQINTRGEVSDYANTYQNYGYSDEDPAIVAPFGYISGLAVDERGALLVADGNNRRVRKIDPVLPGFRADELLVAGENGEEIYTFDAYGRHLRTVDTYSGVTVWEFNYDPSGRLSEANYGGELSLTLDRDENGQVTAINTPTGTTEVDIDEDGFLTRLENASGSDNFDFEGGLLSHWREDNAQTSWAFTYDELGRLNTMTDPTGGSLTLEESTGEEGDTLLTVTSGLGRTRTFHQWSEDSRSQETNNAGVYSDIYEGTSYLGYYDGTTYEEGTVGDPRFGLQSARKRYAGFYGIYAEGGDQVRSSLDGTWREFYRSAYGLNPDDPLAIQTIIDETYNGYYYSQTSFDVASRTLSGTTAQGYAYTMQVDQFGHLTQLEIQGLAPITVEWGDHNTLLSVTQNSRSVLRQVNYATNSLGQITAVTDALGNTTHYTWGSDGQLETVTTRGETTTLDFDPQGHLTSIQPPGRDPWTLSRDAVGRVISFLPAGSGAVSTRFAYNSDHQFQSLTLPYGDGLAFDFDSSGRVVEVGSAEAGTTYYWDEEGGGQLYSVVSSDGAETSMGWEAFLPRYWSSYTGIDSYLAWTFDGPGLYLTAEELYMGYWADSLYLSRDNDGRITQTQIYPYVLTVGQDSDPYPPQNVVWDQGSGLLSGTQMGSHTESHTYDSFGDVADSTWEAPGFSWNQVYTRDPLGRIETLTEEFGQEDDAQVSGFSWDERGRLLSFTQSDGATVSYTYDGNGNRVGESYGGSTSAITSTFSAQDRQLSWGQVSYTWRSDGALATRTHPTQGTTRYDFDVVGHLKKVTLPTGEVVTYGLDALGHRVDRSTSEVTTHQWMYGPGHQLLAEYNTQTGIYSRFVWGVRGNVPAYMVNNGHTYAFVVDQVGSPRYLVEVNTGAIAQALTYDVWGRVLTDTNPGFQPFGFMGGLIDPDTNLLHLHGREYDPEVGRWATRSASGFAAGDTNLYAFNHSDPVNYIVDSRGQAQRTGGVMWGMGWKSFGGSGVATGGDPQGTYHLPSLGDLPAGLFLDDPQLLAKSFLGRSDAGFDLPDRDHDSRQCIPISERLSVFSTDRCGRRQGLLRDGLSRPGGPCDVQLKDPSDLLPELTSWQRPYEYYDELQALLRETHLRPLCP